MLDLLDGATDSFFCGCSYTRPEYAYGKIAILNKLLIYLVLGLLMSQSKSVRFPKDGF